MIALIKTLQVILALSILIIIHELGHFFFAKIFGIRVDKFFLFFDAGDVKLFSTKSPWFVKLFPKAAGWETEYGIGWLPLGGYCKIAGMVDESMDTEYLNNEPQPWEFRTKPAWQRLLVMFGGVLFNFIFAIITYACILYTWGESYLRNEGNGVYVNELAYEMGFRNGDRILLFDDYEPDDFWMLQADLVRRTAKRATVLRGQDTLNIYIDQNMIGEVLKSPGMFDLAYPFIVTDLSETSPNRNLDIRSGDRIIGIDSSRVEYIQDARPILRESAGREISVMMLRDSDTLCMNMQVDSTGALGVFLQTPEITRREFTFLESIPGGCVKAWDTIGGYLKDLRLVFTPSIQVSRQFHCDRTDIPVIMELVQLLQHHCLAFHHAGSHEPAPDTCIGWRTYGVHDIRNDNRKEAERQVPVHNPDHRNDTCLRTHVPGIRKRYSKIDKINILK